MPNIGSKKRDRFPDFLCIGAQKAGTSWLYHNFSRHPDIWMTPHKEINFFNIPRTSIRERLFSREHHHRLARKLMVESIKKQFNGRHLGDLVWHIRFTLMSRSDSWYGALFERIPGMLTGDVTPQYANLAPEAVKHAKRLVPNARIIYILRDPIDRSWSNVAHSLRNQFEIIDATDADDEHIARLLNRRGMLNHCAYLRNLANWEAHFPHDRVRVFFFDDLVADPARFYAGVLDFIGARSDPDCLPPDIDKPRHVGGYSSIPARFEVLLAERHIEDLQSLHQRFDNPATASWLQRAETVLTLAAE